MDRSADIVFTPNQGKAGGEILSSFGEKVETVDTLYFYEGGKLYSRSTAVLKIVGYLGFPWILLKIFFAIPRPLRDLFYNFFARHRYAWYGKTDACRMPTPQERARFID